MKRSGPEAPQLGIRLNAEERDSIRRAASGAKRSESGWARLILLDAASTGVEVRERAPAYGAEQAEAADRLTAARDAVPGLVEALLELADAARHRAPLARLVIDLAELVRGSPHSTAARRSPGRRTSGGKEGSSP